MKPTIGRIVIFVDSSGFESAAMINRVANAETETVDLTVFPASPHVGGAGFDAMNPVFRETWVSPEHSVNGAYALVTGKRWKWPPRT